MTASYPAALPSLSAAWDQFLTVRSISLSPTGIATYFTQAGKSLARCPVQDLSQGRQILLWFLSQQSLQSARLFCAKRQSYVEVSRFTA